MSRLALFATAMLLSIFSLELVANEDISITSLRAEIEADYRKCIQESNLTNASCLKEFEKQLQEINKLEQEQTLSESEEKFIKHFRSILEDEDYVAKDKALTECFDGANDSIDETKKCLQNFRELPLDRFREFVKNKYKKPINIPYPSTDKER